MREAKQCSIWNWRQRLGVNGSAGDYWLERNIKGRLWQDFCDTRMIVYQTHPSVRTKTSFLIAGLKYSEY